MTLPTDLKTNDGRSIHFKIEENCDPFGSELWQYDKITAFIGRKNVGYIKIAYMTKRRFKQFIPTIFNFVSQLKGIDFFTRDEPRNYENYTKKKAAQWRHEDVVRKSLDYRKASDDDLRKLLMSIYSRFSWTTNKKQIENIPLYTHEQLITEIKDYEKVLKRRHKDELKRFYDYNVDKPEPHYILVEQGFAGLGIGRALYIAANTWLSDHGLHLYSSTTITPSAKKAWDQLERQGLAKSDGKRMVMI